ncbi:MAG: hypothetical protein FJ243_03630 [Nitrospira sp.]|nr:hypothetical protein [Nitrospira sp.]
MWKLLSRFSSLSLIIIIVSCATPRVELPLYEGVDVRDLLYARNTISSIEGTFSIVFEKNDKEVRGDGMLNMSRDGDLQLRIYSFGFLALELISEKGIIKSTPKIDRNSGILIIYGLRDSLFWWNIRDFDVTEEGELYLIKNQSRMLWIDKKTMMPVKQTISIEDGRDIKIFYEGFNKVGDVWYPLKITMELSGHLVTVRFKELSFASGV